MNNSLKNKISNAKIILIPKGDDSQPCLKAFQDATGVEPPEFLGRKLIVKSKGQTFIKVKGRDIPTLINSGYGDVGMTGSDTCEEYSNGCDILYEVIGEKMCKFVLLAPNGKMNLASKMLQDQSKNTIVATSFPKLLTKCAKDIGLSIKPAAITPSGSVEIMSQLLDVDMVADIVSTGETARINGLVEVKNLQDIYPAIVIKNDQKQQAQDINLADIKQIDKTLDGRCLQINDLSVNSYTLNLLRDPNKAGKKAGEEFGESMMAIYGDNSVDDCEGEIADLIYGQLAAARSKDKMVKLENIIKILVERNKQLTK